MTRPNFHENFDKQMNGVRVLSYGGGSPRWVRVIAGGGEMQFSVDEARDLRYALDRFLSEYA